MRNSRTPKPKIQFHDEIPEDLPKFYTTGAFVEYTPNDYRLRFFREDGPGVQHYQKLQEQKDAIENIIDVTRVHLVEIIIPFHGINDFIEALERAKRERDLKLEEKKQ